MHNANIVIAGYFSANLMSNLTYNFNLIWNEKLKLLSTNYKGTLNKQDILG